MNSAIKNGRLEALVKKNTKNPSIIENKGRENTLLGRVSYVRTCECVCALSAHNVPMCTCTWEVKESLKLRVASRLLGRVAYVRTCECVCVCVCALSAHNVPMCTCTLPGR